MTNVLPLRKAMIVIAVSRYNGLPDLPGTLTSANRMVAWAEGNSPARNYTVLKITDEEWVDDAGKTQLGEPVTRNRLEDEIRPFIENNIWDRVVVYFAGHGMAGTSLTDYWLLHNARYNPAEGVNFLLFKTAMERQGIGSLGAAVGLENGQVSYIVDACRTVEEDLLGFLGSPILKWPNNHKPLETDIFLSTVQGAYSFQPNAVQGRPAYCLFSDALSDALEGRVPEVIETNYHRHAPVITSSTLAKWIREELPIRAKKFNETLYADPKPGFITSNDFYEVFNPSITDEVGEMASPDEGRDADVKPVDGSFKKTDGEAEGLRQLSKFDWKYARSWGYKKEGGFELPTVGGRTFREDPEVELNVENTANYPLTLAQRIARAAITVEGRPHIALPLGTVEQLEVGMDYLNYRPRFDRLDAQPIFVRSALDASWTLVPAFSNATSSVVLASYPGNVFLVDLHGMLPEPDLSLTRFAGLQPSRVSDAIKIADAIRTGKSLYPNKANRAGYLYYLASDRANALRTGHFMAREGLLSFDLALVAAQSITYTRNDKDQLVAHADLAAIERDTETGRDRPDYAKSGFDALYNVPLTSPFPIYRQGWDLLQIVGFRNIPKVLHKVAKKVSGQNATVLPDAALRLLARSFNYEIIEFGD